MRYRDACDCEQVIRRYPVIYTESMNTVLRQELIRYNRLISVIHKSLRNLTRAIQVSRTSATHLRHTFIIIIINHHHHIRLIKSYHTQLSTIISNSMHVEVACYREIYTPLPFYRILIS